VASLLHLTVNGQVSTLYTEYSSTYYERKLTKTAITCTIVIGFTM